jgi:hypothetical protein
MIQKKKVGRGVIRTLVEWYFRLFSSTRGAVYKLDTSRDAQFRFTSNETVPVGTRILGVALFEED